MKAIIVKSKVTASGDNKNKTQTRSNTLDVKRINLQKEPSDS